MTIKTLQRFGFWLTEKGRKMATYLVGILEVIDPCAKLYSCLTQSTFFTIFAIK